MKEFNSSTVPNASKMQSSFFTRSPVNKEEVPRSPVVVYTLFFFRRDMVLVFCFLDVVIDGVPHFVSQDVLNGQCLQPQPQQVPRAR